MRGDRPGDIRVTDDNLLVIHRLRRLALRNISVYSNYPIRPAWAALKDGTGMRSGTTPHRALLTTKVQGRARHGQPIAVLAAGTLLQELEINSPRPAHLTDAHFCEWIAACKQLQVLHLVCNAPYVGDAFPAVHPTRIVRV